VTFFQVRCKLLLSFPLLSLFPLFPSLTVSRSFHISLLLFLSRTNKVQCAARETSSSRSSGKSFMRFVIHEQRTQIFIIYFAAPSVSSSRQSARRTDIDCQTVGFNYIHGSNWEPSDDSSRRAETKSAS